MRSCPARGRAGGPARRGRSVSATEFTVRTADGVELCGEESDVACEGPAVVLLHGLTATRRYVVMGSRLIERSGYRVVLYDARGHGLSGAPADKAAYGYNVLARDLEAVLDARGIERAVLAGASMGAHTILRFALDHPERVAALGIVTPAFDPATSADPGGGNPLAAALREGGVEGFLRAYDFAAVPPEWRETVETVVRQRLSLHADPEAVADALEVVPFSRPFESIDELSVLSVPMVVVASRDEVDPAHPLALAERYVRAIPGATLTVEEGGPPLRSPIAWQGGRLSKMLLELADRADGA
jgi:pimeloyl-ACP methyl ester carboxylesterase